MTESGPKAVKQLQREVKLGEDGLPPRGTGRKTGTAKTPTGSKDRLTEDERKKRHKRIIEDGLPPRGTGRRTGTAKTPTGPSGRLTEEERKKRHKRMVEQGRTK